MSEGALLMVAWTDIDCTALCPRSCRRVISVTRRPRVSPCAGGETGLPSLPFALRSPTTRYCPRPPGVATRRHCAQSTAPPMARRRDTMRFAYSPPRRRYRAPSVTPALRSRAALTGSSSPRASPFPGSPNERHRWLDFAGKPTSRSTLTSATDCSRRPWPFRETLTVA